MIILGHPIGCLDIWRGCLVGISPQLYVKMGITSQVRVKDHIEATAVKIQQDMGLPPSGGGHMGGGPGLNRDIYIQA